MKILYISRYGQSPVRIYRGEGVLERLKKIDPSIDIVYPVKEVWVDALKADVAYFLRCQNRAEMNVAMDCLSMGLPVWYDIDDDFFNIPRDNPASQGIADEQKAVVDWFLKNATAVSVTTNVLLDQVVKHRGNAEGVHLIPNALDDYAFPDIALSVEKFANDVKIISWRGGVTHQGDLLHYASEIWSLLANTQKNVKLCFMGYDPWYLVKGLPWADHPKTMDYGDRISALPYSPDYYSYMGYFKNVVKPWAHMVPLHDNQFNRAKSNIALLEAVWAGAIPVVPWMEGWDYPAVIPYFEEEGKETLSSALMRALSMTEEEKEICRVQNVQYLLKNHVLSVVNQKRIELLKGLVHA